MYDFVIFFFIFTLLQLVLPTSLVTTITFLDSLFLNAYGNIKYGLVQSFNFIVKARTRRVACKTLNWDMRKLSVPRFSPGPYT